jgi:uncharacterized damage-inducible protein DinB
MDIDAHCALEEVHGMTRQDIIDLFEFDKWAIALTLESVSSIPAKEYLEDLKSSHGGIHGTLVHLCGASNLWLQRWRMIPAPLPASVTAIPNLEALKTYWKEYQVDLTGYLSGVNESMLTTSLSYKDLRGNPHSEPLVQQMQHMVNHSSYHRGQIVTMQRQIGSKPVGTDLITYYRNRTK